MGRMGAESYGKMSELCAIDAEKHNDIAILLRRMTHFDEAEKQVLLAEKYENWALDLLQTGTYDDGD